MSFKLVSKYKPSGDQPAAIRELIKGIKEEKTSSFVRSNKDRKTFTISNVIEAVNKPVLVFAHNKPWLDNYIVNLRNYFLITELNILSHIMIIINQRLMCHQLILTLKRTLP